MPKAYNAELNTGLKTKDAKSGQNVYKEVMGKMRWRYLLYIVVGTVLHALAWYYVTAFCSVYISSSISWICGGFISLIIKLFITQMLLPLIHTVIRAICVRFPNRL
jgi:hypothetical protein